MSPPSTSPDRQRSERRKERAAFVSILASAGLTLGKGAAGFATGSLALISDAANSLLDVAATTMTWLAVRAAHKPADAQHHYGHGKFESLSALAQTAFLFLLSGVIAVEGVRRLSSGETEILLSLPAVGVVVGSIVVDAWRWWGLTRVVSSGDNSNIISTRVARETGSEARAADALHFSSDLVNSVFVLVAFAAAHFGYPQADALIAIGVSFFIAFAGLRLARRTIDTLLDTAPKGLAERVTGLAEKVPGVVGVDRVRVRSSGSQVMGEVGIRVSRTLPLDRVTLIKERVRKAIAEDLPDSEFTISTTPVQIDDETVLERVMLIAARLRVPVHHVTVQNLASRLSVSFDPGARGGEPAGNGAGRGTRPAGGGGEPHRAARRAASRRARGGCRDRRPHRFVARQPRARVQRHHGRAQRARARDPGGLRRQLPLPARSRPRHRDRARYGRRTRPADAHRPSRNRPNRRPCRTATG
mgnify:CR=1 FL=1